MTDGDNAAGGTISGGTDRDLVRRILSCDDAAAKDCLWQKYRHVVETAIAGELRHARQVEIEDIAVEVWLTVLDPAKLGQWRAETPSIRPWILAIARNRVNDYGRRIREVLWDAGEEPGDLPGEHEDPENAALAEVAKARLLEALDRCMAGLSDAEYSAFSEWLDGGSLTDLARELGKNPNAVYQDLHRAKRKVFGKLLSRYRSLLPEEFADEAPRGEWRRG